MNYVNYSDALLQLQAFGLEVDHLQVNTHRPVRCKEVKGGREKRGWYWLSDIELRDEKGDAAMYVSGAFGIWRGAENIRGKIKISRDIEVTREQLQAMAERHRAIVKRAKAERQAEAKRAAARAQKAWAAYLPAGESPYLRAKQVGAHGVRFSPSGNGTLAVPMQDTSGRIWGLQIIRPEARSQLAKEYWPQGLDKVGHFHLLGAPRAGGLALIGEGYATCGTVYEQGGGVPVAVAFDAGNLVHVGKALAEAYPGIRLGFLADDDYIQKCRAPGCGKNTRVETPACEHCGGEHGQKNPGVEAAKAAAHAVGGFVLIPRWPFDRAGAKLTDYNDLACHAQGGAHHVRAQLLEGLTEAGVIERLAGRVAASAPPGGAGDSRKAAVSVMALDELVERFIPIDDGTGETVFDTWSQKLVLKKQMVALLAAGLKLDDVKRHPMWINRGSYYLDQVGFDPSGNDTRLKINTWTGWPSAPQRGNCELALDLLRHLCQGEENGDEIFDWVIRWLAYPLQHPGAKMQTALVVHGPQGTGKSIIFEAIAKIYGDYSMVLNQGAIEDKFNSDWAARKLFIVADEIVARQEMHHIKNLLKGFITQEWIRVNPKNLPAYRERNHMNMVFLSNERQPLVLENDDRRHCVIWTSPPLDQDYYRRLGDELANGGLAALHQHLLDVELGDFKPWTKPPMTKSKGDLIDYGRNSVDRFVRDWQALEIDRNGEPLPFCPCQGSDLYAVYRQWCHAQGERELAQKHLIGHLKKMRGWTAGNSEPTWENFNTRTTKNRKMIVPSRGDMADSLGRCATGRQADLQPDKAATKKDWLTKCFFAFRDGAAL